MEAEEAASSLESLMLSFNTRISQLQELIIARNSSHFSPFHRFLFNLFYFAVVLLFFDLILPFFCAPAVYPASSIADLSAVDAAVKVMELQVQSIKARLREETLAIPKAKRLIEASLKQQKKLQEMSLHVPSNLTYKISSSLYDSNDNLQSGHFKDDYGCGSIRMEEEPVALPKEKKGRGPPPLWYITADELGSLSSYMRGRLTLEKVNAAINDMATYAEANGHLITSAKKKLPESMWERALELRDIATTEAVKGKHFFLESDAKGPSLKLDNTGKAILTVLRHLGRISETRVGHHRVIILSKPH